MVMKIDNSGKKFTYIAIALHQSDLTLEEAQPYLREAQRMVAERKAS